MMPMQGFEEILSRLDAQMVLCVGDLMLDEFVYGDVSRISPEAATPVLAVTRRETEIVIAEYDQFCAPHFTPRPSAISCVRWRPREPAGGLPS